MAAKAKAAAQKAKERRMAGQRDPSDPYAPHTDASRAKAQKDKEAMQGRWHDQTRGGPSAQGKPALAGVGGGGKGPTSRPIGRPGPMQMAGEGAEGVAIGRKPPIHPTGELKGKPTGIPEKPDKGSDADIQHNIVRQNEAADALAYHGYKVEHKPKVLPSDHLNLKKDPDYRIEGQVFDCYTPTPGRTLDKIRNEISKKVKEGQANHIVLNLTDNSTSVKDINTILTGHKGVKGSTYGPLSQVLGVRPKPGAQPVGVEGGINIYAPQDMDVFQIFPQN